MSVSFDPKIRLKHMADYLAHIHLNLPPEDAEIQLLRCRLVGYRLVAQLKDEGYSKKYIDDLMAESYKNLREKTGIHVEDPYINPCASQYQMLDRLKAYALRDPAEPFMKLLRAEFKKVFVPTLRLLTDLCTSKNKYSWEEVKFQLHEIMRLLQVDVNWDECESHLKSYLQKVAPIMGNGSGKQI
jgi:hypothetical protein